MDASLSSPLIDDSYKMEDQADERVLDPTATGENDNNNNNQALPDSNHKRHFWQNPSQITAMVSNFSTSYNVVNISLVLPILKELYPSSTTPQEEAAVSSSLLAGMMLGQVLGGALGDSWLGRLGALKLVMTLQILASLGSAATSGGSSSNNVFVILAVWRFVLGIGAGGVYPLAAVLSAEEGSVENTSSHPHNDTDEPPQDKRDKLQRVVLTFSMQGLGFLSVGLVTVPLLYLTSNLDVVWRLVLGFGSLPGIALALLMLQLRWYKSATMPHDAFPQTDPMEELVGGEATFHTSEVRVDERERREENDAAALVGNNEDDSYMRHPPDTPAMHSTAARLTEDPDTTPSSPTTLWQSIRNEPDLAQKFVGTAGTWFLFDMLFYGNTLFEPIVLEAAFGGKTADDEIKRVATDSLLLSLIALPGYIVSAVVIGRRVCYVQQTPRFVQSQGFAFMALLYAVIGAYWSYLRQLPALLVLLYGATFFFANYGPNTTTFVFPSIVYSHDCRSTLNGMSAAAGKLGALLGAVLFEPAANRLGDARVMLLCAAVSVLAFTTTRCFVKLPDPRHHPSTV